MASSSKSYPFVHSLMNLTGVISPDKEKSFSYLSKFFEVASLEKLNIPSDELTRKEKIFHDMIQHPSQHEITRIKAWKEYVNWIARLFTKRDIRYFLVLENFTKSTSTEKDFFNDEDFLLLWINYMELVSDPFEVAKFMKKYEICTNQPFFWNALAIIWEKEHDFISANQNYLEGFEKKLEDKEKLQKHYKDFEDRIIKRIEREVKSSSYSSEEINAFIQNERRMKSEAINKEVINSNNKRQRNINSDNLYSFINKKKKVEFYDNAYTGISIDNTSCIQHGNNPIYVDEIFRKSVIPKCIKLVEDYTYVLKFLLLNDISFKLKEENYLSSLKIESDRKPASWINGLRILPESICKDENLYEMIQSKNQEAQVFNKESKIIQIKKQEVSVDEVMNNIFNQINQKSLKNEENLNLITKYQNLEIKGIKDEKKLFDDITPTNLFQQSLISNTNTNTVNQSIQNNLVSKNQIQTNQNLISNLETDKGTIHFQDGRKYKVVKVETNKKETLMSLDVSKLYNEECKTYMTLEQKRAFHHFAQLELKKKEMAEKSKKRKTIIYKVDSDGDVCMSSDDEEIDLVSQSKTKSKIIPEKINIPQPLSTKAIKLNFTEAPIIEIDYNKSNFNFENIFLPKEPDRNLVKNLLPNSNKPNLQNNKNFQNSTTVAISKNLFNNSMTIDEINNRIKEATNLFNLGKITVETRDNIYSQLEHKIIELENIEKDKIKLQEKEKTFGFIQSFSQVDFNQNVVSQNNNPFLPSSNNHANVNLNFNKINKKQNYSEIIENNELASYLDPKKIEIKNGQVNNKKLIQDKNFNLKKEVPISILKNPIQETPFSKVSRSLDFSNVNLVESELKPNNIKPPSGLCMPQLINNPKQINFYDKTSEIQKEFSLSFDEDHSHIFKQQPVKKIGNCDDELEGMTPQKSDTFSHHTLMNLKDTPSRCKQKNLISDIYNKQNRYTDINNIFDKDDYNDCDINSKIELSKIFGNAIAPSKAVNDKTYSYDSYGFSTKTEKTSENTYLNEDSFFFKK